MSKHHDMQGVERYLPDTFAGRVRWTAWSGTLYVSVCSSACALSLCHYISFTMLEYNKVPQPPWATQPSDDEYQRRDAKCVILLKN